MYYLSIHDRQGICTTRFADFSRLEYNAEVNGVGSLTFTVSAGHPALEHLRDLAGVRLYRREARYGIPWQAEGSGILLGRRWQSRAGEPPELTCSALHPNWLLSTRIVDWKSGTPGRSLFSDVPAETIARSLVLFNASSLATEAEGRERDGVQTLLPISVEADGGRGRSLDWTCAYQEVLGTLQRLATVGGGDFELLAGADGGYVFRWFDGQRGTDRRTSVFFSLPLGNLANPAYTLDSRAEKTVAVVGGRGTGLLRPLANVYMEGFSAENDREGFAAALETATPAGLQAAGRRYLADRPAAAGLEFDVLQIPSALYGKHYFLGDLVSVRNPFNGADEVFKVQAVRIRLEQGGQSAPQGIQVRLARRDSLSMLEGSLIDLDLPGAESGENDVLEGSLFSDASACFTLDGGGFQHTYLSAGISGGRFPADPG